MKRSTFFSTDQTPEEVERTKQFAVEVIDLLKHSPQCRMPFNKFIPAYHHHFGKQCKVADYGFTKLIELFEAIPHVLQVIFHPHYHFLVTEERLCRVSYLTHGQLLINFEDMY